MDLDPNSDLLEKVIEIENELKVLQETQTKKLSLKWWALYISAVFNFTIIWYAIFPLVDYMFSSLREASSLRDSLSKAGLVPDNYSIQDVVTQDLYILAWDLNNRSPRFFSKKS